MNKTNLSRNLGKEIRDGFPKTPEHFNQTVKITLEKQLCENKKYRMPKRRQKWIAVLAAMLLLGTSVFAASKVGLFTYLSGIMKPDDASEYLQEEVNQTVETKPGTYSGPLWEISQAWYDGATLFFYAEPTEEGKKYDLGTDHILINGQDFLMNYYAEDEEINTGRYICKVDLSESDISGRLDVTIPLKVWQNDNPGENTHVIPRENADEYLANIHELEKQLITFSVEENKMVKLVREKKIPLEDGEVEINSSCIAPSKVNISFTYRFRGSDAEEKATQLFGTYRITDDSGNSLDTMYGLMGFVSIGDPYVDAAGNHCKNIEIETAGIDADANSLTFTPYRPDTDDEGKAIPDTGKDQDYGAFSVTLTNTTWD